jgi:COMPASS component SWD3
VPPAPRTPGPPLPDPFYPTPVPFAQGAAACKPLRGHANFVVCLHFCPRTNLLASGSYDESLRLWDLRTGGCVSAIPAHSEPVTSVQFSGDGALLASGSYDGLLRLWDVAAGGQCLKTVQEEGVPPVSCARWSPNGRYLLSAHLDGAVRLWEPLTSKRVRALRGHANARYCAAAAFVVNGGGGGGSLAARRQLVLCGGEAGAATAWDVKTGAVVQTLGGHNDLVLALDAHPRERAAVTGGSSVGGDGAAGGGGGGGGSGADAASGGCGLPDHSIRFWGDSGAA